MYPLNMIGKNPLKMIPRSSHKPDDIERTMKVSHVEEMPTMSNNYYQDLLKKMNENKNASKIKHPFGAVTVANSVNRSPLSVAQRPKFP